MKFVLFTDNIADLSVREACRAAKAAGFDGLDLTVRPRGHVLPENVDPGLGEAFKIAAEERVEVPMISTAIDDAHAPTTRAIIVAAHYHIRTVKLGMWRYTPFGTLARQLDDARRKLEAIVAVTRRYNILPCLHAHSGPILSNGPVMYQLLKDFSPQDVGAYVDPMHMTLEGGSSGWEMALDLLAPWVALVGVKNFTFRPRERDGHGQLRFEWKYAPLADGMAPLPEFFQRLKQIGYDGTVSLHSEYKGRSSFRQLTTPQLLEQSAADLRFLKSVLARI